MFAAVRERLSDTLLRVGAERALERQEMQRSLMASADHNAPGYAGALTQVHWESALGELRPVDVGA